MDTSSTSFSRIGPCLEAVRKAGRTALIPYTMAGLCGAAHTVELMHAMVAGGADILELGMPFSDPMADGPVIQRAAEVALSQGIRLVDVLKMVEDFRRTDMTTPVVLMGYANPIERFDQNHGSQSFVTVAARAGVDGMLVVDYPPEECADFKNCLHQHGMDQIFLLAPTSTTQRMAQIGKMASGYVYYVSLRGVTGASTLDIQGVADMLPLVREHINIPVGVGFGIRDAVSASAIAAVADGVVIGSKIIEMTMADPQHAALRVSAFLGEIRTAMDRVNKRK